MNPETEAKIKKLFDEHRFAECLDLAYEVGSADVESAIEVIFFLFNAIAYPEVDLEFDQEVHHIDIHTFKKMSSTLQQLFWKLHSKYENNAEFLFFVGYMMALNEWAFGLEDFELAYSLLKRAMELEPENKLYEWGYKFSTGNPAVFDPEVMSLTEQLYADKQTLDWLESRGEIGCIIADAIRSKYHYPTIGSEGKSEVHSEGWWGSILRWLRELTERE